MDVVVIGGGLSGLVAAHRLMQTGVQSLLVLEAKGRVGGRTLNEPSAGAPATHVESGGQWVGPTQSRVLALARELGVGTFKTHHRGRHVMLLNGQRRTHRLPLPLSPWGPTMDFVKAAAKLQWAAWRVNRDAPWTSRHAMQLDGMSLREWVCQNTQTAEARALFDVVSGLTLGGDPADLSLLGVLQHLQSAGGLAALISVHGGAQDSRFVGGAQELSLRLAKALGPRLRTQSPVTQIQWADDMAIIHSASGVVRARQEDHSAGCIPTLPPGLLADVGPFLKPRTGPLIWAGTESSHIWSGYMDGAVRAGEQAARAITRQMPSRD